MSEYITEDMIHNCDEKQLLEYYAVYNFLKVYARQKNIDAGIIELSDSPDVKVKLDNKIVGMEVATPPYDQKEAEMLIKHKYCDSIHGTMWGGGFVDSIQDVLNKKSKKNYGKNTWLIIRTASPIFDERTLEMYKDRLIIPPHNFEQIWIVFNSTHSIKQIS